MWENGLKKDEKVGQRAIELLEKYADRPFFFFVHFAEIDTRGHHQGENSPKQRQAYRSADHWLGEIVRTLEELGIYDDTLVYVTSDSAYNHLGGALAVIDPENQHIAVYHHLIKDQDLPTLAHDPVTNFLWGGTNRWGQMRRTRHNPSL